MKIGVLFVGELEDRGFNASAHQGALAAAQAGHDIRILTGIPYDPVQMETALESGLRDLDAVIFIGGQGDRIVPGVAARHPDKRFAIIQGHHTAANLASYDVLQEQSAFLAGCLAARMTKSGTVAHLSGHRVRPGLKGRAAFCAGARHADPAVTVLTSFCGTQDDNAITKAWADAQIDHGADIIFTMLNGARDGAINACQGRAWQIGNALNWCAIRPDIFMASAEARIDLGVRSAIDDLVSGHLPRAPRLFGLGDGDAVRLTLGAEIPAEVADDIAVLATLIAQGHIIPPEIYDGPEFTPRFPHV